MKVKLQKRLQARIIERLIELHELNHGRMDPNVKDGRQAIFLLQGAAITSAINASKLDAEAGMIGREWRYIVETTYAISFFDEIDPNDRRIKAWFEKDGYPERPTKKAKRGSIPDTTLREQQSGLGPDIIEQYDAMYKNVSGMLSAYAHPTFKSAISNTRSKSRKFDYYQEQQENKPDTLTALRGIFVAEAMLGIIQAYNTFSLDAAHAQELLAYKRLLETDFTAYL